MKSTTGQVPRVSVVVPTFNRAEDLRRCLTSLCKQTMTDFEVIVCDDGSTDNTAEVAASFQGRLALCYTNDVNFGGAARPRNRGLNLARGPYVAFLDSDDWWEREKLQKSLQALEAGADVVYHDLYLVRSGKQTEFKEVLRSGKPKQPMFEHLMCTGISIPNSSIVARRNLLRQTGGFSEDKSLIAVEDFDMLLSLSRLTDAFVRISGVHGYYWFGGGNISAASERQMQRTEAVYKKNVPFLPKEKQAKAGALLAYRLGRIAYDAGLPVLAEGYLLPLIRDPLSWRYKLKAIYLCGRMYTQ